MKRIAAAVLVVAYVVAAFTGVPEIAPRFSAWFLLVLSALFVWAYLSFTRGRAIVPVGVVLLVSPLFPLAVLAWIGQISYHSWGEVVKAFLTASYERGQLWGLEMALPSLAAMGIAFLFHRKRSNTALNTDARPGPRAG